MRNVYYDHAGVPLRRGPEVVAPCPLSSDDQRQYISFSRKITELVHRRGSGAWRLAGVTDFTAYSFVSPERSRLRRTAGLTVAGVGDEALWPTRAWSLGVRNRCPHG